MATTKKKPTRRENLKAGRAAMKGIKSGQKAYNKSQKKKK